MLDRAGPEVIGALAAFSVRAVRATRTVVTASIAILVTDYFLTQVLLSVLPS